MQLKKNYSVSELECLAIVSGIKQFSSYLSTDIPFTIITDHQALKVLNSITTCQNGRIARWALYLQGFRYTVQYRKGELNNADALSRLTNNTESVNNVCCPHQTRGKSTFSFDNSIESNKSLAENETENDSELCSKEVSNQTTSKNFLEVCFEYDKPKTVFNLDTDRDFSSKQIDNTSKLIDLQKKCPDFENLYEYLRNGKLPEDEKECRKVMYDKEFYEIVDGILIHKYQSRGKRKPTEDRFIIQTALPKGLRLKVMEEFHDHNGHFGIKKLLPLTR